jgi:hypothetical protein
VIFRSRVLREVDGQGGGAFGEDDVGFEWGDGFASGIALAFVVGLFLPGLSHVTRHSSLDLSQASLLRNSV